MNWFATEGYSLAELAQLNRCRLHLQVTILSDIISGDGSKILSSALEGRHMKRPSTYNWVPQKQSLPIMLEAMDTSTSIII
eukprot:3631690-Ditylum_brightwellii.AAC.1